MPMSAPQYIVNMNNAYNEKFSYVKITTAIIGFLVILSFIVLALYYKDKKFGKNDTLGVKSVITREDIIKGSEARVDGAVTEKEREAIIRGATATVKKTTVVTEEERRAILEGANAKN